MRKVENPNAVLIYGERLSTSTHRIRFTDKVETFTGTIKEAFDHFRKKYVGMSVVLTTQPRKRK